MADFDVKPTRRDYSRNSNTQRRVKGGVTAARPDTIEVALPHGANPTEEEAALYRRLEDLNINKGRNWEIVDNLKREHGDRVVMISSFREETYARPPRSESEPKVPEVEPLRTGKSRAGPVVKTNKSQAQRKREQQHARQHESLQQKPAKPTFLVPLVISESTRHKHHVISRDGGETAGCSCKGCRGWVAEEPARGQRKKELLDL